MPSPSWSEVAASLKRALRQVVAHDAYILENAHHEQSVAHRIGVYLEAEFPEWDVDCEYNRAGGQRDPKKIVMPSGKKKPVRPDVIVHHRGPGPKGQNLLAVEIKPTGRSPLSHERDRYKLRRYLREHGYSFAVLVTYRTESPVGFEQIERVVPGKTVKRSHKDT